ncbi:hypothetical protein RF11_14094 [Thelohanellus kitauei]|uniref:Uncharacterized protein n=1 Tax=Thelohanellus kitauei TaxID=669202 RepID=A0A0C2NLY9_THEKT|nr:hypothetical protein RF11_14094 [Thelohanellus kitauei]
MKFIANKREKLIREQAKAGRQFFADNRTQLKKELDVYRAYLRQEKSKQERELMNKKRTEIQEWLNVENMAKIESQRNELADFDKSNDLQLKEIQEYQDLHYERCEQDEMDLKHELAELYKLKKQRDVDFEDELKTAKYFVMEGIPTISIDTF